MTAVLCSDCLIAKATYEECVVSLAKLNNEKVYQENLLQKIGKDLVKLQNEQEALQRHLVELLQVPTEERDTAWENDLMFTQNRLNTIVGEVAALRVRQDAVIQNINGLVRMIEYTEARQREALVQLLQCPVCNA
jgi:hypothetical protein